jgi:hypothetical protein
MIGAWLEEVVPCHLPTPAPLLRQLKRYHSTLCRAPASTSALVVCPTWRHWVCSGLAPPGILRACSRAIYFVVTGCVQGLRPRASLVPR